LTPEEARAVAAVIAELMDDRIPLVRPGDLTVDLGMQVMGRRVPGTGLVVCYVPGGDMVGVVNIRRP
jgi:hypothetical protein